jgi:hypothetical protein
MDRRGRTCQIVNLIDFEKHRHSDIVAEKLEIIPAQKVLDVQLAPGKEIIEADHVVVFIHEPLAQVRSEKPRSAGNENSQSFHIKSFERS